MLLILSVTLFFFAAKIAIVHSRVYSLLCDTAGEDQEKMAALMASAVANTIDEKIELIMARAPNQAEEASLGGPALDETSGGWVLPVSVGSADDTGKSPNAYKSLLKIDSFCGTIKDFKIGRTGRAVLVDDKTYVVSAEGAIPFSRKFCSYDELQKVLDSRAKWFTMNDVYGHEGKAFAAFSAVEHPLLSKKGIVWRVFVVRSAKEVFAPLIGLTNRSAAAGGVLMLLLALTGFILVRLFIKPIRKLNEGIERLGRGDLTYRIKVGSRDEIGRVVDSFNKMVEGLGETTTSAANLTREVANRKNAEEKTRQIAEEWQKAFDSLKAAMGREKEKAAPQGTAENDISELLNKLGHLSDATNIKVDKIEIKLASVDIKELIKKALFIFEPKIREKGLSLKLNIPKGKVYIEADTDRISQVLEILINNSVKFTRKGYIAISVRDSREEVECGVTDTGRGIPKEEIPKLFDGFRHLNLSIAKGIIDKHNGKIWIESEPDKITKAVFKLPKKQTT